MKDDREAKRIETLRGMTNIALVIMGVAAGLMIFIGIMELSIYFVIGIIIALLIVIIYNSVAVYCDIALNVARIREEANKMSIYIQKLGSKQKSSR